MDEIIKMLKHFALPAITGGFEALLQQGFSDALGAIEKKTGFNIGANDFSPFGSIDYWDRIHKSIKNTNQQLGITGNLGNAIEDSFQKSTADIKNLGLEWKDVADEYKSFIEDVGRNRQLTSEELINLAEVKAVYGEGFSEIFSSFDLLGVSINQTSIDLQNAAKIANEYGINTAQIMKELKTNIGAIDKFNFNNGRKGLMEMARLAVETKINMQSVLGFADKIWEGGIEGAIEMGSELQLLGGEFAALGDPFELFYTARNEPVKFMETIKNATKSVAFFNEQTGEIDIDAHGFSQLRELAKLSGISLEELSKSAKTARTEMEISGLFDSSIQNAQDFEKTLKKVAGAATFDSGQWQVNIDGMSKAISELTGEDITKLSVIADTTKEEEIFTKVVTSNESLRETIEKLIETLKLQIIPTDLYKGLETKVQVPAEQTRQNIIAGDIGWIGDWFKNTFQTASQKMDKTVETVKSGNLMDIMGNFGANTWDSLSGGFSKILKPMIIDPIVDYISNMYSGSWLETVVNGIVTTVNTLVDGITRLASAIGDLINAVTNLPSMISSSLSDWWNSDVENTEPTVNRGGITLGQIDTRNTQVTNLLQNQVVGSLPANTNIGNANGATNAKNIVTIPLMYTDGGKTTQLGVIDAENTEKIVLNKMNGDSSAGYFPNTVWKRY